jgi:hypothetical protein
MRTILSRRHLLAGITVLGLHGLWYADEIVHLPWIERLRMTPTHRDIQVITAPSSLIRLSAVSPFFVVAQKPKQVQSLTPRVKPVVHSPSLVSSAAVHSPTSAASSSSLSAMPKASVPEAQQAMTSSASATSTAPTSASTSSRSTSSPPSQSTFLVAWPDACTVHYTVNAQSKGFSLTLSGQLIWTPDQEKKTYHLTLQSHSVLLRDRVLSSQGQLTHQGLQPTRFSDKNRTEQAAHLIWDQNKIVFSNNSPEASLEAGMQDRVSLFLQMSSHLLSHSNTSWHAGDIVPMAVTGVDGVTHWDITFEQEELLSLKNQSLLTQKWVKGFKERDNRAELWFAPSLQFLPVRIRQTQENGDVIDMRIDSIISQP